VVCHLSPSLSPTKKLAGVDMSYPASCIDESAYLSELQQIMKFVAIPLTGMFYGWYSTLVTGNFHQNTQPSLLG
jgi:hypothetical protein